MDYDSKVNDEEFFDDHLYIIDLPDQIRTRILVQQGEDIVVQEAASQREQEG